MLPHWLATLIAGLVGCGIVWLLLFAREDSEPPPRDEAERRLRERGDNFGI